MSGELADSPLECAHCREPAILTVGNGVCPRCFHLFEWEAARAGAEMDRILTAPCAGSVPRELARRLARRATQVRAVVGRAIAIATASARGRVRSPERPAAVTPAVP